MDSIRFVKEFNEGDPPRTGVLKSLCFSFARIA